MPAKDNVPEQYYMCPMVHGYSGHACPAVVEKLTEGSTVVPRYPLEYFPTEAIFAEYYERRSLALPFRAWTMDDEQKLIDERVVANLGEWVPPKTTSGLKAIKDKPVDADDDAHGLKDDEEEQLYALGDLVVADDGSGDNEKQEDELDAET